MPQGWDQWGLVGAMVLGVLGLFSWLLRASYTNFANELAAAREERKEICQSFSETLGNHFQEFAGELAELNRNLGEMKAAIERWRGE